MTILQAVHAQLKGIENGRSCSDLQAPDILEATALRKSAALNAAASSQWCQVGFAICLGVGVRVFTSQSCQFILYAHSEASSSERLSMRSIS